MFMFKALSRAGEEAGLCLLGLNAGCICLYPSSDGSSL